MVYSACHCRVHLIHFHSLAGCIYTAGINRFSWILGTVLLWSLIENLHSHQIIVPVILGRAWQYCYDFGLKTWPQVHPHLWLCGQMAHHTAATRHHTAAAWECLYMLLPTMYKAMLQDSRRNGLWLHNYFWCYCASYYNKTSQQSTWLKYLGGRA